MNSTVNSNSSADLAADALHGVARLVRDEIALAKVELRSDLRASRVFPGGGKPK